MFNDNLAHSCTLSPCYVGTEIKIDCQYREPLQWHSRDCLFMQSLNTYKYSRGKPLKWTIDLHLHTYIYISALTLMLTLNFVGESLMSRLSVHLLCLESLLKVKSHASLLWFTGSYQCIQIIVSCAQCTPCKSSVLVSFLLWFTGSLKCWGLIWLKWLVD